MSQDTSNAFERIQAMMAAEDFGAALSELDTLLAEEPQQGDALYFKAVCLRYLIRFYDAGETLNSLLSLFPSNGRGHQEQGHWYRDQGQMPQALAAYARATELNPALAAAFSGQIQILEQQGRAAEANPLRLQLHNLQSLPKPLVAVMDLIHQGKLLRAEDICRAFLKQHPRHLEGMRLLADIGVRLGVMDDAEFLLESAVAFAPDHIPARMDYVQVLRKRQRFEQALAEAQKLLEIRPDNPQFQSIYAVVCMQTGEFEEALQYFNAILDRVPGDASTLTAKGHALKTQGDSSTAVECYRQAYASKPDHGEAFYSLANLKTYQFSDAEFALMHDLVGHQGLALNDETYVSFALGKGYEDRGDFEQSFHFYQAGNRLKKADSRYDPDKMAQDLADQKRVCNPALFAHQHRSGCVAPDPIFIVGLPRAGSTLLEQILSSHSQVDGTLELPNILSLSHRLRRTTKTHADKGGYPDILWQLSPEQLRQFGEDFLRETQIHRQGAPFFIDKMPNNFRHIGLIKLILPNAKIIDARREAMACCFSGYKQLFAEGQEFSYDLENIGRYYRDYVELMDHWDEVLPGWVLRVQHEDVLSDLEGQVRRLLTFCGLPFEEACLKYYETQRNVRTPSSEQVRQPIFTDSVEQWQNFSPWLQPLRDALGDVARQH